MVTLIILVLAILLIAALIGAMATIAGSLLVLWPAFLIVGLMILLDVLVIRAVVRKIRNKKSASK